MDEKMDSFFKMFQIIRACLQFSPYTHFYTQVLIDLIVKTYNTKVLLYLYEAKFVHMAGLCHTPHFIKTLHCIFWLYLLMFSTICRICLSSISLLSVLYFNLTFTYPLSLSDNCTIK